MSLTAVHERDDTYYSAKHIGMVSRWSDQNPRKNTPGKKRKKKVERLLHERDVWADAGIMKTREALEECKPPPKQAT